MEDYSIIQGQTLLEMTFALLLIIVTAYVYVSCRVYAERMNTVPVARLKTIRPASTHKGQESSSALPGCLWLSKHSPSVGDWLVPLIVWTAVIWIMLAVVSIFLGES
jgi:hypothetical protein